MISKLLAEEGKQKGGKEKKGWKERREGRRKGGTPLKGH
jgi:hypothetical protein